MLSAGIGGWVGRHAVTVYLIASNVNAAHDKISELSRSRPLPSGLVVPILKEPDMRGRTVAPTDTVLICGSWDAVPEHRVAWLVDAFNAARRDTNSPTLRHRPGEAPEVAYPMPDPIQDPVTKSYVERLADPPVGTTQPDPTTQQVQVWNGHSWSAMGAMAMPDPDSGMAEDLAAAREEAKKFSAQAAALAARVAALESWLSGVLPVEDPEIPGIYYCAVCMKRIPNHSGGCPAAPV